ncbi:hypothetical protein ACL00X_13470 [Aeromonas diversa]|uniref:hypothetical protein n=1 Tax=Aeromonas diversa TaxID=502790 RepID=UPI0039A1B017
MRYRGWWLLLLALGGCDLALQRYRVEFEDGSWREISFLPFADEARWREGCKNGEVVSDLTMPLAWQERSDGERELLIGGEPFETDNSGLYRSNGILFGHTSDFIQRGLHGLEACRSANHSQTGKSSQFTLGSFGR